MERLEGGATLDGPKETKKKNKIQKMPREHLTPIAARSLCVPLSHWYFEATHGTITRTPRSNARDVIEVPSLQAAADAVLDCAGSHACLCKYYSGSNNAKWLLADAYVSEGGEGEKRVFFGGGGGRNPEDHLEGLSPETS